MSAPSAIPDPRLFPDVRNVPGEAAALYAQAEQSLAAGTLREADVLDRGLRDALCAKLFKDGAGLASVFACAPSVAVYRHLWRQLDAVWRIAAHERTGVSATVFALPLVIVVATTPPAGAGL